MGNISKSSTMDKYIMEFKKSKVLLQFEEAKSLFSKQCLYQGEKIKEEYMALIEKYCLGFTSSNFKTNYSNLIDAQWITSLSQDWYADNIWEYFHVIIDGECKEIDKKSCDESVQCITCMTGEKSIFKHIKNIGKEKEPLYGGWSIGTTVYYSQDTGLLESAPSNNNYVIGVACAGDNSTTVEFIPLSKGNT